MPPLPADSIHARACKLKCEKILTRPTKVRKNLDTTHTVTPPKVNSGGTLRYVPPLFSHTCLPGPTFDAYEPSVALRAEPQKKSAGLFRPAQPIFRT